MKEEWAEIEGTNGDYLVSNYGKVFNKRTNRLVGHKSTLGYMEVVINGHSCYIHRLVASAFIPNEEGLPEIDHIDTDKTNNVYTNLRWVSRKGNQNNEITKERMKESNKRKAEHLRKKVYQYSIEGEFIKEFPSMTSAADEVGCSHISISQCCRGVNGVKTIKGFIWKYAS